MKTFCASFFDGLGLGPLWRMVARALVANNERTDMVNKVMHTEGPWEMLPEECDKPYIRVRSARLGCRYKVANVVAPTYEGVPPYEAEETRCNARLIAAAPDLLDALRDLVDVVTGLMGGETVALHNALAAMHKAAGRPA